MKADVAHCTVLLNRNGLNDLPVFTQNALGRFVFINGPMGNLLALPAEDKATLHGLSDFCQLKDRERLEAHFQKVLSGIVDVVKWVGIFGANQKAAFIDITSLPIQENGKIVGVTGIVQDVTGLVEEENALRESSLLHNQIQKMAHLGYWTWDVHINKVIWSDELFKIYGLDKDRFKATFEGYLDLLHPDDRETTKQVVLNALQTGEDAIFEERIVRPNGELRYLKSWAAVTRDVEGVPIKMFGACLDITEGKVVRKELQRLVDELTKTNNDLQQFSYITSHNLRGPVTNLISMTELIDLETISDARNLSLIKGIQASSSQLNETLNDLINILIIKSSPNLPMEEIDLASVCERVLKSIACKIEAARAQFQIDFEGAPTLRFNVAYLESILLNLCSNALKYASPHRDPVVLIKSARQNKQTILTFTDNGIGMNMNKVRDRIFGLHQRFHNHPDSKGIGLYLIHAQLSTLGGSISVDSQEDIGTTFTLVFN